MKYTVIATVELEVEVEVEADSAIDAKRDAAEKTYDYFSGRCPFIDWGSIEGTAVRVTEVEEEN